MDKNPIQMLTDQMAELTIRLMKAEQERDEARKSADNWYNSWNRTDAELRETREKMVEEIKKHEVYCGKINDLLNAYAINEEERQAIFFERPYPKEGEPNA